MTKFGDTKMRVSPSNAATKFKLFNHSRQTDEIFRRGKYEEQIKFDKIWGAPSNEAAKIQTF